MRATRGMGQGARDHGPTRVREGVASVVARKARSYRGFAWLESPSVWKIQVRELRG